MNYYHEIKFVIYLMINKKIKTTDINDYYWFCFISRMTDYNKWAINTNIQRFES